MKFSVINHDWNSTVTGFDSRAEADDKRKSALSSFNLSPDDLEVVKGDYEDYEAYQNRDKEQEPQATDGGTQEVDPEVVDHSPKGDPGTPAAKAADPREQTPVEPETTNAVEPGQTVQEPQSTELTERDLTDDPFEWMPGHYVDTIEGSQAINRQGYAVLSQFYDISVRTEVVVGPEDTDFQYCRCKATAKDADGDVYTQHGSAHVERGDDATLLLEMADTRATKRVLALATGVGAVAVEELKNSLE